MAADTVKPDHHQQALQYTYHLILPSSSISVHIRAQHLLMILIMSDRVLPHADAMRRLLYIWSSKPRNITRAAAHFGGLSSSEHALSYR